VVGVEQWAEIRRLYRVERLSIREISRRTGLHRKTVRRALAASTPPRYARSGSPAVSKVDPFKEWICDQLRADPRIESQRLWDTFQSAQVVHFSTGLDRLQSNEPLAWLRLARSNSSWLIGDRIQV